MTGLPHIPLFACLLKGLDRLDLGELLSLALSSRVRVRVRVTVAKK